jgi:stage III sporulation protein SpoIIIAA
MVLLQFIKSYKWIIAIVLTIIAFFVYKEFKNLNNINTLKDNNNRLNERKIALKDSLKVIIKTQTKYINKIQVIKEKEYEQIKVIDNYSNVELERFFTNRYNKDSIKQ